MVKKHEKRPVQPRPSYSAAYNEIWFYVLMAMAMGVFIYSCFYYELTQDDAFISFRYAQNFLNGHGLVFNIGERVEGFTSLAFSENVPKRFEAYGWHTQTVADGNNLDEIEKTIRAAQAVTDKPSLISVKTVIGFGMPRS